MMAVRLPRRLAVPALVLVLLAAVTCGGESEPEEDIDSGIRGLVLLGPQCPVVQAGSPCPDIPMEADVRVVDGATSRVVTTFRSAPDGSFRVGLAPGRYRLEPLPPRPGSSLPFAKPVDITVRPHVFTEVVISYDTGIR
jgi:hypothetical protein